MAPTLSQRATAKARVDDIRDDLGYPSQEFLDTLSEIQKQQCLKYLNKKDSLIGGSAITLAKSLYTSKARFVFELLQNVEDNQYTKAIGNNDNPTVTFHIYPDRIVQECNEDGFNDANLRAICNIGQSSKKGSQSYIGEKGIGFKSVFMVAYKALIESGAFSFFFEHHPGDIGMGMIAPQWEDDTPELDDQLTRITLFLHNNLSATEQDEQNRLIRSQFESIHEAILLFMSKLKRINIIFYKLDGKVEKSLQFSAQRGFPTTTITKSTTENGITEDEVNHYFTHTKLAKNLAKNENREYQDNDDSFSQSNITLAFPLADNGDPLLTYQWIFAYLPTCQMGFKFIIQADFVTQANRQGIVETSTRNKSLVKAIASTFIESVERMLQVPSLRFKWMRYLPRNDEYAWNDLWGDLVESIGNLILATPVLESRSTPSKLKLIEDSRILSPLATDNYGDPLLPDMEPELYISGSYEPDDLQRLEHFGLEDISLEEMVFRAANDLKRPDSRIKNLEAADWQSAFVKLLLYAWENKLEFLYKDIQQLEMFLVRSTEWTGCSRHVIYFSDIEGTSLPIPHNIGLNVLHASVNQTGKARDLYKLMGIRTANLSSIHQQILYIFRSSTSLGKLAAAEHLKFLYMTHHLAPDSSFLQGIKIMDLDEGLCSPFDTPMYIFDDDDYGVRELLNRASAWFKAPERSVHIMHSSYFESIPNKPTESSLSWEEWLYSTCNICRFLPLLNEDGSDLSEDCKYLAKHRPDRFLGYLQSVWRYEKERCRNTANIIEKILDVDVYCCRLETDGFKALRHAYLPLAKYVNLAERFLNEVEYFPFVELRYPLSHDVDPEEWRLLGKDFGLGFYQEDQIKFLLNLVQAVINDYESVGEKESNPARIYDFFLYLHAASRQSQDRMSSCEKIRDSSLMTTTFIPVDNDWDETRMCVWEAPNGLELSVIYALSERYERAFPTFKADKALFEDFFVNTLQIRKECSWNDLVIEIEHLKTKEVATFDRIYALYDALSSLDLSLEDISRLRDAFAQKALVCEILPQKTKWHKIERCLWSTATNIPGKFNVNNHYSELEDFFLHTLMVQECTIGMVYDKLAGKVADLSTEDVANTLVAFSSLIKIEGGNFDPDRLLSNAIWPVISPDNEVRLCSTEKDFVIRDRQSLSDDFASKAWFLNFPMDTVRHLDGLIHWAGLEARYISNAIKEICFVDDASTTPLQEMKWQICQKAHALTRIGVTFNSPWVDDSPAALYDVLKEATTFETGKITAQLILNQNGDQILVEKESSLLHIPDHDSELKVYVTNDELDQDGCFHSKLPRRLAQWIMSDPGIPSFTAPLPAMVHAIQSVLGVSRRSLPTVLDEHGILDIDLEDDFEEVVPPLGGTLTAHPSPPSSGESVDTPQSTDGTDFVDLEGDTYLSPNIDQDLSQPASRQCRSSQASSVSALDRRTVPFEPAVGVSGTMANAYRRLLVRVVENSRHATVPLFNSATDEEPSIYNDPFNLRLYQKVERDQRVGAAGELWVYELLNRLDPSLPGFSLSNWCSTIRGFVSSHPDYSDLQSCDGPEPSDIVYKDDSGVFTNMLVEHGYMEASVLDEPPIQYYIEVKTTTAKCNTAFYMSNSQYNKMARYSRTDLMFPTKRRLYVIFRVYNLLEDTIGLKIIVDPKVMEAEGSLVFTADNWSMVINNTDGE